MNIKDMFEWVGNVYRKKDEFRFQPNNFGTAPTVIFDSMPEEYHHGVCRPIASRKEWDAADRESGSATLSPQEVKKNKERIEANKRAAERELKKDRRNASIEAARTFNENPRAFEEKLQVRAKEQVEMAEKSGLKDLIKENV